MDCLHGYLDLVALDAEGSLQKQKAFQPCRLEATTLQNCPPLERRDPSRHVQSPETETLLLMHCMELYKLYIWLYKLLSIANLWHGYISYIVLLHCSAWQLSPIPEILCISRPTLQWLHGTNNQLGVVWLISLRVVCWGCSWWFSRLCYGCEMKHRGCPMLICLQWCTTIRSMPRRLDCWTPVGLGEFLTISKLETWGTLRSIIF